jgi:hypothetical protein
MLLLVKSYTPTSIMVPLSGVSQSQRASTFGSVVLSPTGSINLGFTTEGKLADVLIISLLLGFSNKFSGVNYTPANNNHIYYHTIRLILCL